MSFKELIITKMPYLLTYYIMSWYSFVILVISIKSVVFFATDIGNLYHSLFSYSVNLIVLDFRCCQRKTLIFSLLFSHFSFIVFRSYCLLLIYYLLLFLLFLFHLFILLLLHLLLTLMCFSFGSIYEGNG